MQIAAMNPTYIDKTEVTAETRKKKPYIECLVEGRTEIEDAAKTTEEFCFIFVKDSSKRVADVVKEIATASNCNDLHIVSFVRFALGGQEK